MQQTFDHDEVRLVMAAPPEAIYELIADVTRMPEFSPEVTKCSWAGGATGPAVGARFLGRSRHEALGEWSTTSSVVEFEPERVFAWAVGDDPGNPGAIWRFRLEPASGGTELSQWVQLGPGRSGLSLAIDQMPDKEQKIVFVRLREFERNMTATLAQIKARAEA